jgi:hypothetical protein
MHATDSNAADAGAPASGELAEEELPRRSADPHPSPGAVSTPVRPVPDITGVGATGHAPSLLDLLWLGSVTRKDAPEG